MTLEENKEIVRRFVDERMNKGNTSIIDELTTSDFKMHRMGAGKDFDQDALKQHNESTHISIPDLSVTIDDIIAEGDKVSVRVTMRGIQTGQYGNIAPSGKTIAITRFAIYRFEGGKIAEAWILNDTLSAFQQLGALPPTSEIGK